MKSRLNPHVSLSQVSQHGEAQLYEGAIIDKVINKVINEVID